jgi:hypothetical protein
LRGEEAGRGADQAEADQQSFHGLAPQRILADYSAASPHGEEETGELAKTAKKTWLSDLGVLRGSFRSGQA